MALSNAQWFANPGVTYEIDNSCRFDGSSSYLTKTFASAGNLKTWTQSFWMKRSEISGSAQAYLLNTAEGGNTGSVIMGNDTFQWMHGVGGGYNNRNTTQVFRDPGAWMHIVIQLDTTQASEPNRSKLWVNGEQVTAFSTETTIAEDATTYINDDEYEHGIGRNEYDNNQYFSGYLAEYIFIDGSALEADSFGETNSTTGQWIPKDPSSLTFGTNGFWLDFADSSALGNDVSGNDQDWTTNGLAAADQVIDTPTDNFCTMNPLNNTLYELSDGNLYAGFSSAATNVRGTSATMAYPTTGKWYWEGKNEVGTAGQYGIRAYDGTQSVANFCTVFNVNSVNAYGLQSSNGNLWEDGSSSTTGESWAQGDTVGVAFDVDTGKLWFSKNNTWISGDPEDGSSPSITVPSAELANDLYPWGASASNTHYQRYDFGQSGFAYTPPSGFSALSTANFDDPTIADPSAYFQPTLYTGDGSTQSVNQDGNSTFEPDFVWIKNRSAADDHQLFDSARGVTKVLISNDTDAETTDADTLTAFDSDGFSLGDDDKVNTNTENYVAWQWLESATPGFDIVTDTGTGSAHTISHSLGVTPEFIIRKDRTATADPGWICWHTSLPGANYYMTLMDDHAQDTSVNYWNNTLPTSSVFSVGASNGTNQNTKTFVTYLFAGVEGFSKFGKYTGNGSVNGPFVWCGGFSPSFIMIKETSGTGGWFIIDDARDPTNDNSTNRLYANTNAAEIADTGGDSKGILDFLSNGFKLRDDGGINTDGDTYVFAAFASTPFKTANAR